MALRELEASKDLLVRSVPQDQPVLVVSLVVPAPKVVGVLKVIRVLPDPRDLRGLPAQLAPLVMPVKLVPLVVLVTLVSKVCAAPPDLMVNAVRLVPLVLLAFQVLLVLTAHQVSLAQLARLVSLVQWVPVVLLVLRALPGRPEKLDHVVTLEPPVMMVPPARVETSETVVPMANPEKMVLRDLTVQLVNKVQLDLLVRL